MPTRKYHHKSTTGCAECKTARVKCDENKPECTRCARQGRSCSYLRQNPDASPSSSSGAAHAGSGDDAVPQLTYRQDLELIHHFSTVAYSSLNTEPSIQEMWRTGAVKQGLKFPFLLHGILALSALHLANLTPVTASAPTSPATDNDKPPRNRWYDRCIEEYGLALALARPELENVNEANCHAGLLFSSVIALIRLGMPQVTGDYGDGGVLEYVLDSFALIRGKAAVSDASMAWIMRGPLKHILADRQVTQPRAIPDALLAVFEAIEERARTTPELQEDKDRITGYLHAVAGLRAYFACHPGDPPAVRIFSAWPTRLPQPFMADLRAHEPMALVVLGYYAVMLDDLREHWWIGDTGKQLLLAIAAAAGDGDTGSASHPTWALMLAPAREQMQLETEYWAALMDARLHQQYSPHPSTVYGQGSGYELGGGVASEGKAVLLSPSQDPSSSNTMMTPTYSGTGSGSASHPSPYSAEYAMMEDLEERDYEDDNPPFQETVFGVAMPGGQLPGQDQTLSFRPRPSPG